MEIDRPSLKEPEGATTDDKGEFRFRELETDRYDVTAKRLGYATVVQKAVPVDSGRETEIEIVMNPLPSLR